MQKSSLTEEIVFKETQVFREVAFFILVGLLQLLFLWGLIQQVILGKPWGQNPASDAILIILNLGILFLFILLYSLRLYTTITLSFVHIRMLPFSPRGRKIPWTAIRSARLVKYDGIRDYLGYGWRYSRKRGWCYTISGTDGIELILHEGKRILIGTHHPGSLRTLLQELRDEKIIFQNDGKLS